MKRPKLDVVLREVDEDRRRFLKAALGGAAFAAPVMASFSMEGVATWGTAATAGISPLGANQVTCSNQSFCANQTAHPLCTFAQTVMLGVSGLAFDTLDFLRCSAAAPAKRAKVFDRAVVALRNVGIGIVSDDDQCVGKAAKKQYKLARKSLDQYRKKLTKLGLASSGSFSDRAIALQADLDFLLGSDCPS